MIETPFRDDHSLQHEIEFLRERIARLEAEERARNSPPPYVYRPPMWDAWFVLLAIAAGTFVVFILMGLAVGGLP